MAVKSKKELRLEFNVSRKTFNTWIKKIPGFVYNPNNKIFHPREVELIYSHLGNPNE